MLLKALTVAAAGLSAVTNAFLVVPEVSKSDVKVIDTLTFGAPAIAAEAQSLKLDCPGCPPIFDHHRENGEKKKAGGRPPPPPPRHHKGHHKGRKHTSHLQLDFQIAHLEEADGGGGGSGEALMVNGFELYPNASPRDSVFVALQVGDRRHKKGGHHKGGPKKDHGPPKDGPHEDGPHEDGPHEGGHHKDGGKKDSWHPKDNTLDEQNEPQPQSDEMKKKDLEEDINILKSHHKTRPPFKRHGPPMVERPLGFTLQVQPVAASEQDNLDLVVIDLQIIEVGTQFVAGIPNVRISLLKVRSNGKLMIAKIETTPSETTPAALEDCTTVYCQWRAAVIDRIQRVAKAGKGCMRSHNGHGQDQRGPSHGFAHGKHHDFGLLVRKLTSHILIPVLVGIVAGISVSIIGMVVGTILIGLWRVVVRRQSFCPHRRNNNATGGRRRSRGSSLSKTLLKKQQQQKEDETAIQSDEKVGLLGGDAVEEQEELPAYMDEKKGENVV